MLSQDLANFAEYVDRFSTQGMLPSIVALVAEQLRGLADQAKDMEVMTVPTHLLGANRTIRIQPQLTLHQGGQST